MDGEGGKVVEEDHLAEGFDLPRILARLDGQASSNRREAVETIAAHVEEEPDACLPTVPKLRSVLTQVDHDCHDDVAACLADLAEYSPADVAPSVHELVAFVVENPTHSATPAVFRALAAVATARPGALVEHVEAIAGALDARRRYDHFALETIATVSRTAPESIAPIVSTLSDALAADPEEHGLPTLPTLGRTVRATAVDRPLHFVDDAIALVDHEDDDLRAAAIGCLDDVARRYPAAVERACSAFVTALAHADPTTRAAAAAASARVAAGDETSLEPVRDALIERLDDDHAVVRVNACRALGYARARDARDRLETLASDDSDPTVRDRARWAVERLP